MFQSVKNLGFNLFGGLMDGQPGAFSQHQGGLRGLLGSFNDGQEGNALFATRPMARPTVQPQAQAVEVAALPPARPRTQLDDALVGLGMGVGAPEAGQRPMVGDKSVPQTTQRPQKGETNGWRTFQDVMWKGISPADSRRLQIAEQRAEGDRDAIANALRGAVGENGFDANAFLRGLADAGVGLGVNDVLSLDKAGRPDYQYFEVDGDQYRYDPRAGGEPERIFDYVDPYADLKRREYEAKIGSYEAQAKQRDNQGDYYAARAAQPYAPPRPSKAASSAGAGGSLDSMTDEQLLALLR